MRTLIQIRSFLSSLCYLIFRDSVKLCPCNGYKQEMRIPARFPKTNKWEVKQVSILFYGFTTLTLFNLMGGSIVFNYYL